MKATALSSRQTHRPVAQDQSFPDSKSSQRKLRLDELLVQRGLIDTRSGAQRIIMAGQVLVAGEVSDKPGRSVDREVSLEVIEAPRYVSRGGTKLEAALDAFDVNPAGWTCADIGASTGGFTDCLLQHGAGRVYAIDVGYGQLAWPLRQDPRVVAMERTNIRYLESLPEAVQLAVVDVSFISLELVLPRVAALLVPFGETIALIKPQFEVGKGQVGKGGVVRDPRLHRAVLKERLSHAAAIGLAPAGLIRSPITGPAGNVEFLAWLRMGRHAPSSRTLETWIQRCLMPAEKTAPSP